MSREEGRSRGKRGVGLHNFGLKLGGCVPGNFFPLPFNSNLFELFTPPFSTPSTSSKKFFPPI
ncbi:MAG: hypothetical protein C6I01_01070 [Epsilonproteobacteria bacterium]|nr:hypothetical protein [Campylobacterota bacterium]